MNIFKKRPLSLILCIMLGAFSLSVYLSSLQLFLVLGAAALLFVLFLLFLKKSCKNRVITLIATAAFVLCGALGSLYFYSFFPKSYGEEISAEALVTERTEEQYSTRITLECRSIDENKCRYRFIWYANETRDFSLPSVGDIIQINCTVSELQRTDSFDAKSYYVGRGYSAKVDKVNSLTIISEGHTSASILFGQIKNAAVERFHAVADEGVAGLFSALVLGERDGLTPSLSLDFSRIGVSHILALSGMHLAILSLALTYLLGFFGLNKKIRTAISIIFTVFYVLLVGMPQSVMRAGIMLIISSLLYLHSSSSDSLTNLSIAVFIIVLFEPYAICDLSLLLSAFATFGIVIFAELRRRNAKTSRHPVLRTIRYLCDATLASVFAIAATLVITASRFTHFSSLAAFSTLVLSLLIEPFVYIGLLLFSFGKALPLAEFAEWYYELILRIADWLSSFRFAAIPYELPLIRALVIIFSVLFFSFVILSIKRKRLFLCLILSLYFSISIYGVCYSAAISQESGLYYTADKTADTITLKSNGELTLVYSGSLSVSGAATAREAVYAERLSYLDNLVIANYSAGADVFVKNFISDIRTGTVYLPSPTNSLEFNEAEAVAEFISLSSSQLIFYETEDALKFGKYTLFSVQHIPFEENYKTQNILTILADGEFYTYVSSGYTENTALPHAALLGSNKLIIGAHGKRFSEDYAFDLKINSITEIYFGADIKADDATRDFYNKKGASVIDTDARTKLD